MASSSVDQAGNYFQTDSSLAESDRRARKAANIQGSPVKFPSKLLAVQSNHYFSRSGDVVFVAEAGGAVSALRLSTDELSTMPRGPQAPLTCLAFHAEKIATDPFTSLQAYTGCWDKSIWCYRFQVADDSSQIHTTPTYTSFPAHRDFVKSLLIARTPGKQDIIISGGADGEVRFWSLDGQSLGPALKPDSRSVECLVLDPFSPAEAPVIMFSTSRREIFSFTLPAIDSIAAGNIQLSAPLLVHETSVYKLYFDDDGDLWTASADKTAKHLVRDNTWQPDTILQHPDYVRDVISHDRYGWVVTASRDEEVRVWNKATSQLHHVFTGHFEEVTGLCLVQDLVVSVSIDGTLRRWSLVPAELQKAVEEAQNPKLEEQVPEPQSDLGMLTEEEEAELRALMEQEEEEALEKMAVDTQYCAGQKGKNSR